MEEKIGIAVACKRFFGLKENQTLMEFASEIRKLSQEEKEWFAAELTKELGVR